MNKIKIKIKVLFFIQICSDIYKSELIIRREKTLIFREKYYL